MNLSEEQLTAEAPSTLRTRGVSFPTASSSKKKRYAVPTTRNIFLVILVFAFPGLRDALSFAVALTTSAEVLMTGAAAPAYRS